MFNPRLLGQEELGKQTRGREGLLVCRNSLCRRWGLSTDDVGGCFGRSVGCEGEHGEGGGWSPGGHFQRLAMTLRAAPSQRRRQRREVTGLGWVLRSDPKSAGEKGWEKVVQLEELQCRR